MQVTIAMKGTGIFWILAISLLGVCSAQVTVAAEKKVIVLPDTGGAQLNTFAALVCYIQPEALNVRWITPDETNVLHSQSGQYTANQGSLGTLSGDLKYGSLLLIHDISYKNAGVYVCEAMEEENCSDFPEFATIELVLRMTLEAPSSNVTVVSNGTGTHTVELQCEATGYIRPDSDIQWFREEEEMVIGEKYNVSFRDGRPNAAQTGHSNGTVPSRVSVLTIHEVDESDAGMYSCRSLDTGEVASLQFSMEMEPGPTPSANTPVPNLGNPTATPQTPESPRPSSSLRSPTSTADSPSSSDTDCSLSIAAAVLCTFALTATLTVFATIVVTYLGFKGRQRRMDKQSISSPVIDVAPQAPTKQGPTKQGPTIQTHMTQVPTEQAPMTQAPMIQGPMTQAPMIQGPMTQAPMIQGPMTQDSTMTSKTSKMAVLEQVDMYCISTIDEMEDSSGVGSVSTTTP